MVVHALYRTFPQSYAQSFYEHKIMGVSYPWLSCAYPVVIPVLAHRVIHKYWKSPSIEIRCLRSFKSK